MSCNSRITEQHNGTSSVVHCRPCNLRRRLQEAAVFVCPAGHPISCGPGCQLRRTLAWWGIRDDGSCGCDSYAAKMDAWGHGCWDHLEEIVEHLRGAAEKKGLPFLATAARILVARAIDAARLEQANGQEAVSEAREADVGRPQ
jgi:hypothetical protein